MKKLLSIALIACLQVSLFGQTEKVVESVIKDVTVYQQGAQISRAGKTSLLKGKTTLVFSGLSSKVDPQSIQASATNGIVIVSVTHNIDYLNKNKASKEIERLEKSRKDILDSIQMLKGIKAVYVQEKEMILSNKSIGGDNGVNITELQSAANFFRTRLSEIEVQTYQADKRIYSLKIKLVDISKQLLELNSQLDLPTSQVRVVVSSEKTVESNINIEYFIADAGWLPNYDIRIKDIDTPLDLTYKAKVFQNTGEDWKNVNLTLSTGDPSISNYKPVLETYYLTFNNYYTERQPRNSNQQQAINGLVIGQITDAADGQGIPAVTVQVKGTNIGTIADIDGNYKIQMPPDRNVLQFSFVGYKTLEITVNSGIVDVKMEASAEMLEEVAIYSLNKYDLADHLSGRAAGVTVTKKKDKEYVPLAIQKRQTSTEFKIEIPYTIPTDNQEYDVAMIEYEIPVQYSYSAVPKLSDDAFLIAEITNWTKYNMLNGNANIFFQEIFQGETYLDLKSFEDTLTLSVGRDKDIIIEREIQKDFVSKSFIGNFKKEQRAWDITIKNNKENPIKIKVEDQFPISKSDDIKVEQIEQSGAVLNADTGLLSWELELATNETKVLTLIYSVRYPKEKVLIVE